MPQYFNIIQLLFEQIHKLLDHFVYAGYQGLADFLRVPLALCITIYLVAMGYGIAQGWFQLSYRLLIKTALKLAVVYVFALNWSFFSENIIELIQNGSSQMAASLLKATGEFSSLDLSQGIEGALQAVLSKIVKLGYWLWRQGSWYELSPLMEAIAIWTAGIILVTYAIIQLVLANIMLSILFILTPLFFLFYLFNWTRNLFDRWLGYLLSYALLIVFVSLSLSLVLSIAQWCVMDINKNSLLSTISIATFVPVVVVSAVGTAILSRVTAMAYRIGLSVSTQFFRGFYV